MVSGSGTFPNKQSKHVLTAAIFQERQIFIVKYFFFFKWKILNEVIYLFKNMAIYFVLIAALVNGVFEGWIALPLEISSLLTLKYTPHSG